MEVAGLRIWTEKPDASERAVRAEGSSREQEAEVPCRCVVRGKAQRMALKGFDCEQCRNFYAATKLPGPKPDLKASRHRMGHAPSETPPGQLEALLSLFSFTFQVSGTCRSPLTSMGRRPGFDCLAGARQVPLQN